MEEMKINISDNSADQRARELAEDCKAQDPRAAQFIEKALADERRRALEEVVARIIDTHRMGDRDAWLDLARLIRAKANAGQEE